MELDQAKVKDRAFQLWALMDSCRFFGYSLTKDDARLKGQYTIHEIYARGDYKALYSDTNELEETKSGVNNALYQINSLKERCAQMIKDLDYFEEVLKKISNPS